MGQMYLSYQLQVSLQC